MQGCRKGEIKKIIYDNKTMYSKFPEELKKGRVNV